MSENLNTAQFRGEPKFLSEARSILRPNTGIQKEDRLMRLLFEKLIQSTLS